MDDNNIWDGINLPLIREKFSEGLAKSILSVQPMGREEYLEGKESRQYPNKYDDFIDIGSLEWYIKDEIERLDLDITTLEVSKSITWPLNLRDKPYKYVDDIGANILSCYQGDPHSGENLCNCVIPDTARLHLSLNPLKWDLDELTNLTEKIKMEKVMTEREQKLQQGYQNYIKYCTEYRIEHGMYPRKIMECKVGQEPRHYFLWEFEERCNIDPEFSNKFLDEVEKISPISPQSEIDWSGVISMAENIVKEVVDGEWHEDNDNHHYMYEEVMEAIYGKGFWDWFNDNTY